MKYINAFLACLASCLTWHSGYGQSLPVGSALLEEYWRTKQLKGDVDSALSFTVRPLYLPALPANSLSGLKDSTSKEKKNHWLPGGRHFKIELLPISLRQQWNQANPYGWNDGAMIPARGYQVQISAGLYTRIGPLSIQLQPEAVFAQNRAFAQFLSQHDDSIGASYYVNVVNVLDLPEKFGEQKFSRFFPGQSSIRINSRKFSFGLSTENLWWGPGVRNSLLMSNNASGFPHLTFNTISPVFTPVGTFEWQLVSGFLKKSGFMAADTNKTFNGKKLFEPKPNGERYLNGLVLTWQPKWTKGFFLGVTRVFYLYKADLSSSFNGYLPVLGQFFKGNLNNALREDARKRDQMFSFFFRWLLEKEKAELYAEYGRNDFAGNTRDFMLEPEHSRAYLFGLRKLLKTANGKDIEFWFELTNLQLSPTFLLREVASWYSHYQVRDGYTNQGQIIGAGIGPGSNSQSIGFNWHKGLGKTGLFLERVVRNNDFYYTAFTPSRDYWRHWVDLSFNFNKSWQHRRFLFDAQLSLVNSLNYLWQSGNDEKNLHSRLDLSYVF